ncbi:MAG: hypothetical protein AAF564_11065 [Bacteroidota bacterium]
MMYLIAKYALLFLGAALLGFLLGRWWTRRRFVDVTSSYEKLFSRLDRGEGNWDKLWKGLNSLGQRVDSVEHKVDAIPAPASVDLSGVNGKLDQVGTMLGQLPKPQHVDLAPVEERVGAIEALIKGMPKPEKAEQVDFAPLYSRFVKLESMVEAGNGVDLGPVNDRISRLEQLIRNLPAPAQPQRVDLTPVNQKIGALEASIRQMASSNGQQRVDLNPVNTRISGVETALRQLRIPGPVNLSPVESRLREIELRLDKLAAKPAPAPVRVEVPKTGPRLMKSASFGKKDDLKKISGVGPKLERLLNGIGVFYFWQVASWSGKDVTEVDDMLEVFKGRIERDNWVLQARTLKLEPTAAKEPA